VHPPVIRKLLPAAYGRVPRPEPLNIYRRNGTFAVTDERPERLGQPREIRICNDYWEHPWTVHSIDSRVLGNVSSEGKKAWCQPGHDFHWFSIGGAALLHEMTHLDAVAEMAGYPENRFVPVISQSKLEGMVLFRY
jgi:hypothetical protein